MIAEVWDGLLLEHWLWTAGFLFLRVAGIAGLAPVFGEQVLPLRLRLAAAVAFTLCVLPMMPPAMPMGASQTLIFAAAEVVTGVLFGLILRLMVMGLQMAGAIAAQVTSLAQIAGAGVAAEPAPAIGNLLITGGLSVAAAGGLHVRLVEYMTQTFVLVPFGNWPAPAIVAAAGLAAVGRVTALAFSLALPFAALGLVYNLLLGVMNRAMPQLMVVFIGAPVIVGISLMVLLLLSPVLLQTWHEALVYLLANPDSTG